MTSNLTYRKCGGYYRETSSSSGGGCGTVEENVFWCSCSWARWSWGSCVNASPNWISVPIPPKTPYRIGSRCLPRMIRCIFWQEGEEVCETRMEAVVWGCICRGGYSFLRFEKGSMTIPSYQMMSESACVNKRCVVAFPMLFLLFEGGTDT